jgi:hypothetical protein
MPKAPAHIDTCGSTEVVTLMWCAQCNRKALRLVYRGTTDVLGPCMGCHPDFKTKDQLAREQQRKHAAQNPSLFA